MNLKKKQALKRHQIDMEIELDNLRQNPDGLPHFVHNYVSMREINAALIEIVKKRDFTIIGLTGKLMDKGYTKDELKANASMMPNIKDNGWGG